MSKKTKKRDIKRGKRKVATWELFEGKRSFGDKIKKKDTRTYSRATNLIEIKA